MNEAKEDFSVKSDEDKAALVVDWIGLDCLFKQPLANDYYPRHPVKDTIQQTNTIQK